MGDSSSLSYFKLKKGQTPIVSCLALSKFLGTTRRCTRPTNIGGIQIEIQTSVPQRPSGDAWVGSPKDPKATQIYGLAITQYENDSTIYRFSCNENWETIQDAVYESPEEAIKYLPEQYCEFSATWHKY